MSWEQDKGWSDRFIPEIKEHLGRELIQTADWKCDAKEGTDLLVFEMNPFRVAARVRRNSYLSRYGDEFTIRAGRPSANETELAKIMSGWGNYLFYGFSDAAEIRLAKWFIGDLSYFRLILWRNKTFLEDRFKQKNTDESSWFFAWPASIFGERFIVAKKGGI